MTAPTLTPCPICGAMLTPSLVALIGVDADVDCPKRKGQK